jgi:hypothetical protein
MRINDIKLAPARVVGRSATVAGAGNREWLRDLVSRRNIFAYDFAGIASINQGSREVAHAFGPQELKSVKRDIN